MSELKFKYVRIQGKELAINTMYATPEGIMSPPGTLSNGAGICFWA